MVVRPGNSSTAANGTCPSRSSGTATTHASWTAGCFRSAARTRSSERARELLADALYEVFRAAEPGTRAIREGIFRYWEGSTTARARSMALLSGAESRPTVFLKEYLTVVGASTSAVLRGHTGPVADRTATARERAESFVGLGRKGLEKLALVARDIRQELHRATAA